MDRLITPIIKQNFNNKKNQLNNVKIGNNGQSVTKIDIAGTKVGLLNLFGNLHTGRLFLGKIQNETYQYIHDYTVYKI